jgi:hypothetical protein
MSESLSSRMVTTTIPGADAVRVRRDVPYRGDLTMDLYGDAGPAVIIVAGYPDPGFQRMVGCRFKEMGSSVSWGRLIAASGMVAVTYTNREPESDLHALLQFLREHGASLGIDANRIGLWASSGNVPLALSALSAGVKGAALLYGYTLDVDEAAATFRFANPLAGKSIDALPGDVPLFIVRAGLDETPRLNETLDRFLAAAVSRNLPVTFVNHPTAPHSFDLYDDSETSAEIIRQVLAFLRRATFSSSPRPRSSP